MKKFKKIYIEITNRCNLNCPFCIKNNRTIKDLTLNEINRIFNEVKEYTDYVYLHLLGEPLLHHEILQILDLALDYNLKVNITTNGSMLKDKYLDLLDKKALRQINVSMHSLVNFNVNVQNEYLKVIADLIKEVIKRKTIYLSLRLWIQNKELNKYILEKLEDFLNIHPLDFEKLYRVYLSNDEEFTWPSLNNQTYNENGMCYGGITHLGILSNGDVALCCLDSKGDTKLGNIFEKDLKDILLSERYQNYLLFRKKKKFTEELCKKCSYHNRFN